MKTLGDRLRDTRKAKKLTQAFVAKASGVSPASVTQWEKDVNQPRGESLISIAKVLDCTPNWLLNGVDPIDHIRPKNKKTNSDLKISNMISFEDFEDFEDIENAYIAETESTSKYIELDFYDIEVSAGHGALVIQEEKDDSICFSNKFITKELGLKPKNIFLMPVKGDSMVPTLKNQALVMVNQISEFSGDGIYVFRFDGQLMVKRLQFTKRGLNVVSDNATTYPSWELSRAELKTEDFEIIGEVVWSGQRM